MKKWNVGKIRLLLLYLKEEMRGTEVEDTGKAISVPVGDATLGRVFNVLGDAIDLDGEVPSDVRRDPFTVKHFIRRIIY